MATRLNRTRTGLINAVINAFTFANGSTQIPAPNFKIAEKSEARVFLLGDSPYHCHHLGFCGVSTSLNLNCSSAPPVFDWGTCVTSANAFIYSAKPFKRASCSETTWTQLLLMAACVATEADKFFSASTRSVLSINDAVNSATSAFAFVKRP